MGKGLTAEVQAPEVAECRHHWLIESPQGATSKGVCKLCGAVKEFRNSLDSYWDEEASSDLGYSRWSKPGLVKVLSDEDELSMSPSSAAKEPVKLL